MSRPISKAKGRLTSQVTTSSTTVSFQATDSNRALTSVTMSDFGTYGYLVINPSGKIGNYAIVRFESWSVSGSVITVGTLQWQTFQGNDGAGTLVEFPAGTTCVIGNSHHLWNNVVRTEDAQTIAGVKTFSSSPIVPTPSGNTDAANKAYADSLTYSGAPDANTTTKGVFEQATNAETKAGTATGGTAAKLAATPADIADAIQSGSWVYAADSVGTDSYAITPTPAISAYAAGQKFRVKAGTANTGTASLAVSGLTAKTIKKFHDQTLETGDIEANSIFEVAYDAVDDCFQLLTPPASSLLVANMTNTQASTLTSGATSNADTLHTHLLAKKVYVDTTSISNSTNAETTIFSTTLPGGVLGTNNAVIAKVFFSAVNGDGAGNTTLTLKFKYAGTTHTETCTIHTSGAEAGTWEGQLLASGATNTQVLTQHFFAMTKGGGRTDGANTVHWTEANGTTTAAIDSTADQTLAFTITSSSTTATITAKAVIIMQVK